MANDQLLQTLSELNSRIQSLIEVQNQLQLRVEELETRNLVLENQHQSDVKKIEQAEKDIEFLTLSHRLADSPDTIISTRRLLIRLIHTINNCITMINEE